jgi:hypothetical protein
MGFTFGGGDPDWVAVVAQLTGELSLEEIMAWVVANPEAQEPVPGVAETTIVLPGAVTYVTVRAPQAAVVCSTLGPGKILIAESVDVE